MAQKTVDHLLTAFYFSTPTRLRTGTARGNVSSLKNHCRFTNTIKLWCLIAFLTGTRHPTEKPVDLCEYLIKTYSNQGDVVLDFTAGSFTTGEACLNTDRRFIGIERDAEMFHDGEARMRDRAEVIEQMLLKPWQMVAEAMPESSQRAMFGEK